MNESILDTFKDRFADAKDFERYKQLRLKKDRTGPEYDELDQLTAKARLGDNAPSEEFASV